MINVIAAIKTEAGKRDEFVAEFVKLTPQVRAEDGCIEYGATIDLDSGFEIQEPQRDDVVIVIEKWDDLDCLKAHLAAPHMNEFREKAKDLVVGISLQITEPVS